MTFEVEVWYDPPPQQLHHDIGRLVIDTGINFPVDLRIYPKDASFRKRSVAFFILLFIVVFIPVVFTFLDDLPRA